MFQGLSGAVAQYRWWLLQETDAAGYRTSPEGNMASPGEVLAAIRRDRPGFTAAHVMYPAVNSPGAAVIAMGGRTHGPHDMSLIVTVDPYRDRVLEEVSSRAGWVGTVTTLHKWAIFGTVGRIVLTIVGLSFTTMSLLGLVLWWRTRRANRVSRGAAALHRATGVTLAILVLSVSITGTALNVFTLYEKSANTSVTSSNMAAVSDAHHAPHPIIGTDQAYQVALARVRGQSLAAFSPAGPHALNYWFSFSDRQLKRTDVLINAQTGAVVGIFPAGVVKGGGGFANGCFPSTAVISSARLGALS